MKQQAGMIPPEAGRMGQDGIESALPGNVANEVQFAVGVKLFAVGCWGEALRFEGTHVDDRLQRTTCAEAMSRDRLGGRAGQRAAAATEQLTNDACFGRIVEACPGAVQMQGIDVVRLAVGRSHRQFQCFTESIGGGAHAGTLPRIAGCRPSGQPAADMGASYGGMVRMFQDEKSGRLPDDDSSPSAVERPADVLWIVAGPQHAGGLHLGQERGMQGGVGPANEGDITLPGLDVQRSNSEGHG